MPTNNVNPVWNSRDWVDNELIYDLTGETLFNGFLKDWPTGIKVDSLTVQHPDSVGKGGKCTVRIMVDDEIAVLMHYSGCKYGDSLYNVEIMSVELVGEFIKRLIIDMYNR